MAELKVYIPFYDGDLKGKHVLLSIEDVLSWTIEGLPEYVIQYRDLDTDCSEEDLINKIMLVSEQLKNYIYTEYYSELVVLKGYNSNYDNIFRYKAFANPSLKNGELTDDRFNAIEYCKAQRELSSVVCYQHQVADEQEKQQLLDEGFIVNAKGYVLQHTTEKRLKCLRSGKNILRRWTTEGVTVPVFDVIKEITKEDTKFKWSNYATYAKEFYWIKTLLPEGKAFGITPQYSEWGTESHNSGNAKYNGLQLKLSSAAAHEFKQTVMWYRMQYKCCNDLSEPYAYLVVNVDTLEILEEHPDGTRAQAYYEHVDDPENIVIISVDQYYDWQCDHNKLIEYDDECDEFEEYDEDEEKEDEANEMV